MADSPATEDHADCSSGRIDEAMRWLLDTPIEKRPTGTVSLLRELFGITALEAVNVIRAANEKKYGGATNGSS